MGLICISLITSNLFLCLLVNLSCEVPRQVPCPFSHCLAHEFMGVPDSSWLGILHSLFCWKYLPWPCDFSFYSLNSIFWWKGFLNFNVVLFIILGQCLLCLVWRFFLPWRPWRFSFMLISTSCIICLSHSHLHNAPGIELCEWFQRRGQVEFSFFSHEDAVDPSIFLEGKSFYIFFLSLMLFGFWIFKN